MTTQPVRRALRAPVSLHARLQSASRVSLMLGTALGCSIVIVAAAPGAAWAGDECGDDVGGAITCTATSGVGNPYPGGISYVADAGEDIAVVLDGSAGSAVVINSGFNYGVIAFAYNGTDASIVAEDGVIITTSATGINTRGFGAGTVSYAYNGGDVNAGVRGVWAYAQGDAIAVNAGSITVDGALNGSTIAFGLQSSTFGAGGLSEVTNTGTVTLDAASGDQGVGIRSYSQSGNSVVYSAGAVDASAVGSGYATGIRAVAGQTVSVTTTEDGTIDVDTVGNRAIGVQVSAGGASTVSLGGDINVTSTSSTASGIAVYGSSSTDITLNGDLTVSGYGGAGILASNGGQITITVNGDIDTTGYSIEGITTYSNTGINITVTGAVTTDGFSSEGIMGHSYGAGDITIAAADITTQGFASEGIAAFTHGGDITIDDTGVITVYGDQTAGVHARSYGPGVVEVNVNEVHAYGDFNANGVYAVSYGDVIMTASGAITTAGYIGYGVLASSLGGGDSSVSVGDVTTQGNHSAAIWAGGYNDTVVSDGTVTTYGDGSRGVYVLGRSGELGAGYIDVDLVDVSTHGSNSDAIQVVGLNDVSVTVTGAVSTAGANSDGIQIDSAVGHVDLGFNSITTDDFGSYGVRVNAQTGLSIIGSGAVDTGGVGVYAQTETGDAYVSLGDVTAYGVGVRVIANLGYTTISTGDIDVQGSYGIDAHGGTGVSVEVSGDISVNAGEGGATGVYADIGSGLASIVVVGDTVVTASGEAVGIEEHGAADGAIVDVTGAISATSSGADAYGVLATADYGLIDIGVSGAITADAYGDAYGVHAVFILSEGPPPPPPGQGEGDTTAALGDPQTIDITVGGLVTATSSTGTATGVYAHAGDGLTVDLGDVSATAEAGAAFGVKLLNDGGDSLIVVGDVTVAGPTSATGVLAMASGGYMDVTTGDVSADSSDGYASAIAVYGLTGASLTTGDVTATGATSAWGINASSATGDTVVNVQGDIDVSAYYSATGFSIGAGNAYYDSDASITVVGDITVATSSVLGGARGGTAHTYGDATIDVTGDVNVHGAYSATGFYLYSSAGDAQMTLTGDLVIGNLVGEGTVKGITEHTMTGDAFVDVVGDVTVDGNFVTAIEVQADAGIADVSMDGVLTVNANASATGIQAVGAAGVVVDASGLIDVESIYGVAIGVLATSTGGDITVTTGAVTVQASGNADGVNAFTNYAAGVEVDGDLSVTSDDGSAFGVRANGYYLTTDVTVAGDVTVSGQTAAIGVKAYGDGAVTVAVTGDSDISSATGAGTAVFALSDNSSASVTIVGDTVVNAYGDAVGVHAQAYSGGIYVGVTGDISVTSETAAADGIEAATTYGDIDIVVTGGIDVTGVNSSFGIVASFDAPYVAPPEYYGYGRQDDAGVDADLGGSRDIDIAVTGPIVVHSSSGDATGISAIAPDVITVDTGDVTATADVGSAFGLYLRSYDIDVTVGGDLVIDGDVSAFGMNLQATGGVDVVMTGDITADGGWAAYGILVNAAGAVSVDVDGLISVDAGSNASGIQASSSGSTVDVHVVDLDISGGGSVVGVNAAGYLDTAVTATGQVTSTGSGISARSNQGSATATVVDVTAGGDAVWAITNYGDATVTATGEIISGGAGLSAWTSVGDANVTNEGSVTTTGFYAYGIRATTDNGDANVDSEGPVETAGDFATGILARSNTGDVNVSAGTVETTGDSAVGIRATTNAGDVAIDFGSVSTLGSAVLSGSYGGEGGPTYFEYGDASHGIVATANYGSVSIIGGDVFTDGSGAEGIVASGYGSVLIDVGTVQTEGGLLRQSTSEYGDVFDTSTGAIGIDAHVRAGDLSIYADAVYTAGDFADGINATAQAGQVQVEFNPYDRPVYSYTSQGGDILIDVGTVQTLGDNADAVYAFDAGGDVTVIADAVYTFGDSSWGVQAASYGYDGESGAALTGNVSVDVGALHTFGDHSLGIYAASQGGDIIVTADAVLTTGYDSAGVIATANQFFDYTGESGVFLYGDVTVDVGSVVTRGDSSSGVMASAARGDVSVSAVDIYTRGDNSIGIDVTAGSDANVLAANVVTYGYYSDGVRAEVTGNGRSTIEVDYVAVHGYGSDAVYGISGGEGGETYITVTGIVSSAYGTGVRSVAGGYSSITVDHGQVSGAYAGIVSTAGYATLIENDGGFIYGGSGLAIQVNGGLAQITSSGVIYGRVDLTENGDSFANSGLFEAYGTSAFGAGFDVLTNANTVGFSRYQGAASTTTFTGLESFDNTGRVSGVDGQAGDVLSMAGTVFHGGTGSQLALDVQFGGPGSIADRLTIGQATGVTTIVPNSVLAATPGVLNFDGILVVDSAFASQTGAEFTMTPVDAGFVDYSLRFDAPNDNWLIVALPDASAFRLLTLSAAVQDFWQRSDRAVISHWQESRDADGGAGPSAGPSDRVGRGDGWQMWMQGHAGDEGFTDNETFTIGGATFVENQSHNSDWRGFQFGADDRMGAVTWGVTGGFVQQETRFDVGGESFDIEGWNAGAYVGWMANGFFANALAKGDFNTVDANLTNVADMESFDARTLGVQGELGYRFTSDSSWFVEPVANLSWSTTRVDSFTASGATVDFGDSDSLLGRAGLRFGATMGSGDVILTPALGVFAINEFEGENTMTFTTGGTGFSVTDTPPGSYGQVQFGVTAQTFYGLEGYVRGEWNVGGDAEGGAVRLGARWRW